MFETKYKNTCQTKYGKLADATEDNYLAGVIEGFIYIYAECQGKSLKSLVSVKSGSTLKNIKFDKSDININASSKGCAMPNVTFNLRSAQSKADIGNYEQMKLLI